MPDRPRDLRTEDAVEPLAVAPDSPRFSWRHGPAVDEQTAYCVRVALSEDGLADQADACWDSGRVESGASVNVAYDGPPLDAGERYAWAVRAWDGDGRPTPWSRPAHFETALDGVAGEWITAPDAGPAPLLRREFALDGEVTRARLRVAAAGTATVWLDGERVGDAVLDTADTDYRDRVLYATHDVTDLLDAGANAVGAALGRGRYALESESIWDWHEAPWNRDRPALRLALTVEFADGGTRTVATGPEWDASGGPTTFDSLYEGEDYDARRERDGWTDPGFGGDWEAAEVVAGPDGDPVPQRAPPMSVARTVDPDSVAEPEPGVFVFDVGEMVAGWARLTVAGPAGTEVALTYGERLHDDGTVDVEQDLIEPSERREVGHEVARDLIQTDTYTLSGDGTEVWEPRYSYKGFRYVQVAGYPGTPTVEDLTAAVVHTGIDAGETSTFAAADDLLERVRDNSRRALLNNHHGLPTDTPVYEKNGWTGDAQLTAEAALYEFEMPRFYRKWLADVADAQKPDGRVPSIAPAAEWGYDGAPMPGWDAAYVFVPWWTYRYCGDRRLLATHYGGMCDYLDFLADSADADHVVHSVLGDWLPPAHGDPRPEPTDNVPPEGPALTSTAYFYRMAAVLGDVADLLGEDDDAESFRALADEVRADFHDRFFDADRGYYRTGETDEYRQTSNVFPLAFGLVPDRREDAVVESLVRDVRETRDGNLNTGILGTKYLLPVLTEYGHVDLAHEVATRTAYPSWGHWIEHGATALYEAWELDARSRDHHMFGSVVDWLYGHLAGVSPAEPGFERVDVAPSVPAGLDAVDATVATVRGEVTSSWRVADGQFTLEVRVPGNTTATVRPPVDGPVDVRGDAVTERRGGGDGRAVFEMGAGSATFGGSLAGESPRE